MCSELNSAVQKADTRLARHSSFRIRGRSGLENSRFGGSDRRSGNDLALGLTRIPNAQDRLTAGRVAFFSLLSDYVAGGFNLLGMRPR